MNNRLYTIQEVANILGVSTKTLRRWDQRGRFVPTRTVGSHRRYTEEQIQKFKVQILKLKGSRSLEPEVSVPEPFFKPETPKEVKPTLGLPSVLRGLPSGSFLKNHFLLRHKGELEAKAKSDEHFEPASFARSHLAKLNPFWGGLIVVSIVLMLSFAGAFALIKYNVIASLPRLTAGLAQKEEQFAKFIANLPRLQRLDGLHGGQAQISLVPQDNQAVLAAAEGASDLILNVNVPSFFSQNVGIGTAAVEPSAILDVSSEDKGFLAPRMTTVQRDAITAPAAGLFVYNTDTNHYNMYNGTAWQGVFTSIGDSTLGEAFTKDGKEGNSLYFHGTGGGVGQLTGGGISGTQTYTFPNASGEISLLGQSISNSELVNSKVTVSPGTNMTGGGEVALGSSITLTLKDSVALSGTLSVAGATTLNSTVGLGGAATDAITFTGRVAQDSDLIPIGTTGTNDLGSSALPWDNLYANNVIAGGTSGIFGWLQRNSGALSPTNISDDLLLGATSTSSAKFGILNMAGGSPTATISSNLSLIVPTGSAPSATLNLLNNGTLNFQRSPGGDAGLTNVLFLQNNGNVGIGNTNPLTALDVTGSASLSANLSLRGAGTAHTFNILDNGTLNFQRYPAGDAANNSTVLFLQNNGNVGIGNTAPSALLSVGSTSQFQVSSTGAITGVGVNSGSGLIQGTGGLTVTGTGNINATGTSATNIGNSTGALTLASGGTSAWTNTSGNLTISTATSGTLALTSAGALNLSAASASTWGLASSSTTALNIASGLMDFDTTNSRVGIGMTNPLATLDVTGSASLSANLSLRGAGTAHTFNILDNGTLNFQRYPSGDAANNSTVMYLENNGNVGIGTTVPLSKLDVNGGAAIGTYAGSTAAPSNGLIVSGNVGIKTTTPTTFDLEVGGNVGPSSGSQYDLGSSARRWNNIYGVTANFSNISTTQATISGTTTQDFLINSDNATNDTEDATLTFDRGTPSTYTQFKWNSTTKQLSTNSPSFAILPDTTIAYSGTSAFMVNQVQAQDILTASASGVTKFTIANNGNIAATGTLTGLTGLTVLGATSINASGSNATDIGTGTNGGTITIGNASTGDLALNDPNWSVTGAGAATFTSGTFNGNVDMTSDLILNIGDTGTDFTSGGGLTLAGALLANGDVTLGNAITDNITFTGRVAQDSDLIPIGTTGTNDLGSSALPWDNLYADNIYSPSSGTSGYWQRRSNALSPENITDDLLLGATSTVSAKFGILNMAGGNPTATMSSNLSLIVPTGNAPAATLNLLNNGTLNFQRSAGGDGGLVTAMFIQNNGNVGIGTTAPSALLSVGSTSQFQVSSTGAITGVGVNSGSGLVQGTGGLTVSGNTTLAATGGNTVGIGNSTGAMTLVSGGTSAWTNTSGNLTISTATSGTLALTSAGALNLNSGGSSAITLTPATDTIFANNTGIVLGYTAQIASADHGGVTASTPEFQMLGTARADSTLMLGSFAGGDGSYSNAPGPGLTLFKSKSGTIGTLGALASGDFLGEILWKGDDGTDFKSNAASIYAEVDGTPGAGDMPGRLVFATTLDGAEEPTERMRITNAGRVGIGTTSPLATLDVRGLSGTTPAASISAQTSFASMIVDNSGIGDLFTASKSGATKFVITNAGNVGIGTANPSALLSVGATSQFQVSSTGAITGVGVNSGSGLIQGTGGITAAGTALINNTGTADTTIGNTAGGTITIGGATGSDLALNDAQWSVTGPGAATFTSGTFNGNVDMTSDLILNIGDTGTDFTSGGGLTLAGALLANGDVTLGNAITDNITFTGRVAQDSDILPIGTTGTNDLGSSTLPWDNLYANNIYGATTGTSGYWQRNSGALSPTNITDDLLLGTTATSTAKFGFINVAGGNPTATMSSNLSLIVPTGNAPAATLNLLNNGTLNFQRSAGGDGGLVTAMFIQNNGNVGIGTTAPSALLSVGSTSQFQVNSSGHVGLSNTAAVATSALIATESFTAEAVGVLLDFTTTTSLGGDSLTGLKVTSTVSGSNGSGHTGIGVDGATIYNSVVASSSTPVGVVGVRGSGYNNSGFDGRSVAGVAAFQALTWGNAGGTGPVTNAYGLLINAPTTTQAVTNAYGIYINNVTGAGTLNYALYSAGGTNYFGGNVGIGNASPLTALDVTGSASLSANLSLRGAGTAHTFNILDNGTLNFQRYPAGDAANNSTVMFLGNNGNVGIGNTTPGAMLSVGSSTPTLISSAGLITVANTTDSTSGSTGSINTLGGLGVTKDLAVDGGDIVTGATTFNLINATATTLNIGGAATTLSIGAATGTVTLNNATTAITGALTANGDVTLGNAITDNITFTGRVAQDSDILPIGTTGTNDLGSSTLPWDNLYANNIYGATTGTSGYWQRNSGALSPTNITDDVLLGATSTSSAKFGFINVAGGNPTATMSSNLSLIVPTGNAPASTFNLLNNGTLNFQRSPGGDAGLTANPVLFLNNNGNVGIGTTAPSYSLDVNGDMNIASGKVYRINGTQIAASNLSNGTTGSGAVVLANTPTLITPALGAATYTTLVGGNITDSGLTAGRVTLAGAAGILSDDADLTFATDTLTVTKLGATTLTGTIAGGGQQLNNIIIGTSTPLAGTFTTLQANTGITPDADDGAYLGQSGTGFSDLFLASGAVINFAAGDVTLTHAANVLGIEGGNVGIGTTNPLAALDVRGQSGITPAASVSAQTSFASMIVDNTGIGDLFTASKSGAPKFVITNAGNVGIGTANPSALLSVGSTSQFQVSSTGAITGVGVNSGSGLIQGTGGLTVSGNTTLAATGGNTVGIGNSTGALTLASGGTSAWTNTSGNLTISTATSGTLALTSAGVLNLTSALAAGGTTNSAFNLTTSTDLGAADELLQIGDSAGTFMTVLGNGYVGIGTTGPGNRLEILGDSGDGDDVAIKGSGTDIGFGIENTGTGGKYYRILSTSGASGGGQGKLMIWDGTAYRFVIDTTGNVGIGNTNPLTALDVTGSASLSANLSLRGAGTAHTFNILDNGTLNFQRYPAGDAANNSTVMYLGNNGNIGIGTTAPGAKLDIAQSAVNAAGLSILSSSLANSNYIYQVIGKSTGVDEGFLLLYNHNSTAASRYLQIGTNESWDSGEGIRILGNGNVGIGNTAPSALLSVGSTSQFQVSSTGAITGVGVNSGSGLIQGTGGITVTGTGNINATGTSATNIGNSTGALTLASGGTSAWTNTSGNLTISTATSGTLALTSAGVLNLTSALAAGGTTNSAFNFTTSTDLGAADELLQIGDSAGTFMTVLGNGYFGIGTTSPGALLTLANDSWIGGISTASGTTNMFKVNTADQIQVGAALNIDGGLNFPTDAGYVTAMDLPLTNAQAASTANGYVFRLGTANLMTVYGENNGSGVLQNGRIGIGTTAPGLRLDVQDSQAATAAAQIYNTDTGTNADGLIVKLGNTSTSAVNAANHFVSFETFGIGIVGSVQGSGGRGVTYATSGIADFAEYFKKDQNASIPFGSVVCFDDNGLAVACDNNSNKIVGVASEHPAFLGGENLGNKSIAVGLVGQVRTRVSAANGAIKIGDPLTTSSTAGVAIKATSTGQILGKAIEPFDGAQGEEGNILVSVNITWYNPSIYVSYDGTLAGMAATVTSIGDQLASQGDALQAQIASNSASLAAKTDYVLANDPLFTSLNNKTTELQSKIDLLSLQVEQQASISAFLAGITSSQVLGASTSALLNATLGDVELNNATISGSLNVLGRTTVTDLGVTGNINAGLLAIHGLDGEINTLTGDLYLQRQGAGGVDILNGKVVIDTMGNMKVVGTIIADSIEANNYSVLGDQSIGSATISAGLTFVEIFTPVASDSSKIFLTPTSLTDKQLIVLNKSGGKFKVAIPLPTTTPITFDWWIVGNK